MASRKQLFRVVANHVSEECPVAVLVTAEFADGLGSQLGKGEPTNSAFMALSNKLAQLAAYLLAEQDDEALSHDDAYKLTVA